MAFLKASRENKDIRHDIHLPSLVTKDKYKDESDYCQICRLKGKRRIAEHFCTKCALPLCPACKHTHETTRVTADHAIVPKKERDVSTETCPVHRFARVEFFCDSCLQLVCVNCTMIEHKKHDIMEIPDKVEQCHKVVTETVDNLDTRLRTFEQNLKQLTDLEEEIENNREQVKTEINNQVVLLQQRIRVQQEDLIRQLDRYLDEKIQVIAKQKDLAQQQYNEVLNVRSSAEIRGRSELQDEAFIQNVIQLEKQTATLKAVVPVKRPSFKFMNFALTNDARLGNIEESDAPIIKERKATKAPKTILGPVAAPRGKVSKTMTSKASASTTSVDMDDRSSEPNMPVSSRVDLTDQNGHVVPHTHSEPAFSRNSRNGPLPQPRSRASQNTPTRHKFSDTIDPNLRIVQRFKTNTYIQNASGIGVLPNGKYVLTDAANYGILLCDKSGRWQQKMFQDEVAFPTGIAVTRDGDIAVATHKYIKVFKVDGIKVRQFQVSGNNSGALAVDDYGHFVVVDNNSRRVVVYNEEGMQIRTIEPPDLQGMRPDAFNIGVGGDHLALSYTSAEGYSVVKLYNYRGDLMKTCELPAPCKGIQMDRFGNMIIAAEDLMYIPAKGNDIMPLRVVDKKERNFRMSTRCVAFTPQGLICSLHVNKINQRSELMIMQLGS